MDYHLVRVALSRIEWSETEFHIWARKYMNAGLGEMVKNLKLRLKTEGLINHDRVLNNRSEL